MTSFRSELARSKWPSGGKLTAHVCRPTKKSKQSRVTNLSLQTLGAISNLRLNNSCLSSETLMYVFFYIFFNSSTLCYMAISWLVLRQVSESAIFAEECDFKRKKVCLGSVKANGREPKSSLGWVFNFKLGHFVMHTMARHIQARLSIELKTQPRFCSVSLSLTMVCIFKSLMPAVAKNMHCFTLLKNKTLINVKNHRDA